MVANQALDTARTPGLVAANRRGTTQFSRQPAKTHSPTGTTCNARKPKCSWAGTDNDPGGIAPACWLAGNFGSPQRIETGSACVSRRDSGQLNRGSLYTLADQRRRRDAAAAQLLDESRVAGHQCRAQR